MLDKEVQEKFLKEAEEVAKEAEGLFCQYANDLLDRSTDVSQANSFRNLCQAIYRCRQISGVLEAEKIEAPRLAKMLEAFDALAVPELELRR